MAFLINQKAYLNSRNAEKPAYTMSTRDVLRTCYATTSTLLYDELRITDTHNLEQF